MKLSQLGLIAEAQKPDEEPKYRAAVAIVTYRDSWLLGLSQSSGDDRSNKWVFPGGHIKQGETPAKAAVRETKEEMSIDCTVKGSLIKDSAKKDVAFIACQASFGQNPKPNKEFAAVGWFTLRQMDSLTLYPNVKRLIEQAKRQL